MAQESSQSAAARKALWAYLDENHPKVWDNYGELMRPDVVREAIDLVIPYVTRDRGKFTEARIKVGKWFANPEKYDPHVDKVAVERALNFDWDVIERLSLDERDLFYDKLAAMDDPFEDGVGDNLNQKTMPTSWRGRCYRFGSPNEREAVRQAVSRRKEAMSK